MYRDIPRWSGSPGGTDIDVRPGKTKVHPVKVIQVQRRYHWLEDQTDQSGSRTNLNSEDLASKGVVFVLVNEPLREQFLYLGESRLNG